jgi:hypothetical protein
VVVRQSIACGAWTSLRTFAVSSNYYSARACTFDSQLVVAVGGFSAATTKIDSYNGTTWSSFSPGTAIQYWRLAAGSSAIVAMPYTLQPHAFSGSLPYWTSLDGLTWTARVANFLADHDYIAGLAWDPIRLLFVALVQTATNVSPATSAIWTSPDGITWTKVHNGPGATSFADLAVLGPAYVASQLDVVNTGPSQLSYSPDGGTTWYFCQAGFASNVDQSLYYYVATQFATAATVGLLVFNGKWLRYSHLAGVPPVALP